MTEFGEAKAEQEQNEKASGKQPVKTARSKGMAVTT
jgi:hypothetical protein